MNKTEYILKAGEEYRGVPWSQLEYGVVPWSGQFRKDFETPEYIIMGEKEFWEMHQKYLDSICGDWKEITEERYDEMLNVLPPMLWQQDGFFISEAQVGNVHGFYQEYCGKFYNSFQRTSTPREKILQSLRDWIAKREVATSA